MRFRISFVSVLRLDNQQVFETRALLSLRQALGDPLSSTQKVLTLDQNVLP